MINNGNIASATYSMTSILQHGAWGIFLVFNFLSFPPPRQKKGGKGSLHDAK